MSHLQSFHESLSKLEQERCSHPLIDSHIHFTDFLQGTDGLKNMIGRMDDSNIIHSVVFGMPVVKKWDSWEPEKPHYYLDDNARCYCYTSTDELLAEEYSSLSDSQRSRLTPMLCGFNPTDKNAVYQIERDLQRHGIWKGIGEIFCRHDDLTNLIMDETSRMNHPALLPVYDLAGSRGLPVLIHQNSTSVGHHDHFEYLHEVEEALEAFPGTTFIWAHCGISRRVSHKMYHRMIEEVLRKYVNVYVDLSWVVYDQTICRQNVPKKSWLNLVEEYPDRVLVGSDMCGHFEVLGKTMARYNNLIEGLSERARDLVCRENTRRIWSI